MEKPGMQQCGWRNKQRSDRLAVVSADRGACMRARCSRSTCYLKYLERVLRQCALVVTFSSRFVFDNE